MSNEELKKEIVKGLCRRELFNMATEIVNYILDADDEDAPLKLADVYADDIEQLESKLDELLHNEPEEYNYDKWLEWETEYANTENELELMKQSISYSTSKVSEWWLCTRWMGQQLEKHGELVLFTDDFAVWGREFFGTDPYTDPVFEVIAEEMEILPNQKHDWSKYVKKSK